MTSLTAAAWPGAGTASRRELDGCTRGTRRSWECPNLDRTWPAWGVPHWIKRTAHAHLKHVPIARGDQIPIVKEVVTVCGNEAKTLLGEDRLQHSHEPPRHLGVVAPLPLREPASVFHSLTSQIRIRGPLKTARQSPQVSDPVERFAAEKLHARGLSQLNSGLEELGSPLDHSESLVVLNALCGGTESQDHCPGLLVLPCVLHGNQMSR